MQSLSYHRTEDNIRLAITLDLFDGDTFRLTRETTDSFGTNEEICNGTFLYEGDVLKLESHIRYEYSKYITDIEPSEVIHNVTELFELKKEAKGYLFEKEYLLSEY